MLEVRWWSRMTWCFRWRSVVREIRWWSWMTWCFSWWMRERGAGARGPLVVTEDLVYSELPIVRKQRLTMVEDKMDALSFYERREVRRIYVIRPPVIAYTLVTFETW